MGRLQVEDLTLERFEEIEKLVDLVAASRIQELTARVDGRRITVTGGAPASPPPARRAPARQKTSKPELSEIETAAAPEIHRITAPMVGVFHHSDPPITVGMQVEAGQVIAVIESMKLMNDIRSEEAGTILSMHVDDGLAVEYGQPLFDIDPLPESLS